MLLVGELLVGARLFRGVPLEGINKEGCKRAVFVSVGAAGVLCSACFSPDRETIMIDRT